MPTQLTKPKHKKTTAVSGNTQRQHYNPRDAEPEATGKSAKSAGFLRVRKKMNGKQPGKLRPIAVSMVTFILAVMMTAACSQPGQPPAETPDVEATVQASIASVRAAQPTPLDPEAKRLDVLLESVSDQKEYDCVMEGQKLGTHNTYQCLDDESGYHLYRHDGNDIYMTELSEETHCCIWAGMRPLLTLNEGQVKEFEAKAGETYEESVSFFNIAMGFLCMNGSELESELITYDDDTLEEIAYGRCVMEAHGGPSKYTKAIMSTMNSDAEFEEFEIKGSLACGPETGEK